MTEAPNITPSFRTSGTNLKRAKTHNHRVVMEIIRTRGPIGRTEISEITSLSRQTVQNIVAELHRGGMVEMSAGKAVGRGHPGMNVRIRADHAYSLGFHVDRLSVTAVACDLMGDIVWEGSESLQQSSCENANASVLKLMGEFRQAHADIGPKLFGVGLAAPGPFEVEKTATTHTDAATFSEFGSADNLSRLEEALSLPVVLQNDASAAALGEHVYGRGRNYSSFAFVQFGIGLGAGFVLNGGLYGGAARNAGEIGHVSIAHDGPNCFCGNRGCLERYLSLYALCETLGIDPASPESVRQTEMLFDQNDPAVERWMEEVAPHMRQMINMIEMMLDPEVIFLGGIIGAGFLKALLDKALPLGLRLDGKSDRVDRVLIGTAGAKAVALGATAAAVEALYAPSVSQLVL